MDSGNSGSLQSSSAGSEEYDSRVESISAICNNNPLKHICHDDPLVNQPPRPLPLPVIQTPPTHSHSSSTMFDPLSYLDHHPLTRSQQLPATTANPSSVLYLDATDLSGFMSVSPAAPTTQQLFTNQQAQSRASFPLLQVPQGLENSNQCSVSATNSKLNNKTNALPAVRNLKKRPRASRRAPTTVLTTDTTNFRAMVQEFTGIPAPPFTSSPFPRTRLDLFGPPSSLRSTHLDLSPASHYLLRPFAQKISPPPFLSSSMADAIVSNPSTNNNSSSNTSSNSTSINYHLPSDLGHLKQPQSVLNVNMQNPILNLHSAPKYPLSGSEEFGLSQGLVSTSLTGLQSMVSSQEHDMNGGCYRKVSNLSSSPSDFHADKEPEHMASRSEGMVESWICSSD